MNPKSAFKRFTALFLIIFVGCFSLETGARLQHFLSYGMASPIEGTTLHFSKTSLWFAQKHKSEPVTSQTFGEGETWILSGGSVAFGYGVQSHELAREISRQSHLKIIDYSFPGLDFLAELEKLLESDLENPAGILFLSGFNDITRIRGFREFQLAKKEFFERWPLFNHSLFVHKLMQRTWLPGYRSNSQKSHGKKILKTHLKELLKRFPNTRLVYVFQPLPPGGKSDFYPGGRAAKQELLSAIKKSGFQVYDEENLFDTNKKSVFLDRCHLSLSGLKQLGFKLTQKLESISKN